jgi:transposase
LDGRRAEAVLADKGYDSDAIVARIESLGAVAVIPSRRRRKVQRLHDRTLYKLRNRIERCFNRFKQFRRLENTILQTTTLLPGHRRPSMLLEKYVDTP